MPLFEKARLEVYVPDLPLDSYQKLLEAFSQEFTYTFGGCSVFRGLDGNYLSDIGSHVRDRVNIIYVDIDIPFESNLNKIAQYADHIREASEEALQEESVLVATHQIFHSGS